MSLEHQQKNYSNSFRNFNDSDSDDEFFVHIEKELEKLNIQHLRVLAAASDEDETEEVSKQASSLQSVRKINSANNTGGVYESNHLKSGKRRSGRRKLNRNPILLSAQYRQKYIEESDIVKERMELDNKGLTYIDCLLFDEERRKRRCDRALTVELKNDENTTNKVDKQNLNAAEIKNTISDENVKLDSEKKSFYENSKPVFETVDEDEKVAPDSALGSEAGSSTDQRADCTCDHISRGRSIDPRFIQLGVNSKLINEDNLTCWRDIKHHYSSKNMYEKEDYSPEYSTQANINFSQINRLLTSDGQCDRLAMPLRPAYESHQNSPLLDLINFKQLARRKNFKPVSSYQLEPSVIYRNRSVASNVSPYGNEGIISSALNNDDSDLTTSMYSSSNDSDSNDSDNLLEVAL